MAFSLFKTSKSQSDDPVFNDFLKRWRGNFRSFADATEDPVYHQDYTKGPLALINRAQNLLDDFYSDIAQIEIVPTAKNGMSSVITSTMFVEPIIRLSERKTRYMTDNPFFNIAACLQYVEDYLEQWAFVKKGAEDGFESVWNTLTKKEKEQFEAVLARQDGLRGSCTERVDLYGKRKA